MSVERIEKLKDMRLITDLREGAEVVVPPGPEWKPLTDRLREALKAAAGQSFPVTTGEEVPGIPKARHRVILGSAMNNPALMALYRRKYAFIDDYYPGGDGHVLRTVHNPEGCGRNVLLVGATRPEGAAAGLNRLETLLRDNGGRFGYTNEARSDTHEVFLPGLRNRQEARLPHPEGKTVPAGLTPEAFRGQTEGAFRGNAGRGPIEQGVSLGLVHHFTHDPDCARMFKDVLFYYEDLVRNRYDGNWCFEHMLFIYAWTWRLFYVWDLIEESDAFTDAERLRMTNLLWGLTNYVAGLPYFRGENPPPPEIRQNHSTFAALSMSFSAGYFKTYYGIDDFGKHLKFCEAIFDGQADCYKPNDDGGGGGYCWLVPNHQMAYDLKQDEFRFLKGGHLRELADYAILITDNLGSTVEFGDVGTYAVRRKASHGVTSTLCRAAWYYEDGSYLWALDWMGGAPLHDCCYRALPKRIPEHMTGISIAPCNRPLYTWVERHGPGGANVPIEASFDKLTLRGGFDEADEYLLMDGNSTYAHGHEDGASVERLTWKGRMWLTETDYIWKRPRHHSSVVSICDGESVGMPSLVALEWAEDFGETAFTRTVVPDCNGTDWTRDVLWVKGKYFLFADALRLLKDADYDLRCLWRTLGDVRLSGNDLTVEQQGVRFRIRNADDSDKTLETEEPRVAGQDPYRNYDFAKGPIRIFKQRKTLHGVTGRTERYFNLMVAGAAEETDARSIARISENAVRIDGPDAAIFGTADRETSAGPFRIVAGAFALTDSSVTLLNAARLSVGEALFESDAPVHLIVHPGEGCAEIRVTKETGVTVRGVSGVRLNGQPLSGPTARLSPGAHRVTFDPLPPDLLREAVRSGAPYVHRRPPRQNGFVPSQQSALKPMWDASLSGSVSCADAQDGRIAMGAASGQVALLSRDGRVLWSHETGAEVRTVRLTDLGGESALLAGGRDCALTRFDADGKVRWKREFIRSHGRDQIVNAVAVADLTGDGRPEIAVATDGWLVWALTPDGEEIWQRQIEHHAARSLAVADVEGDGRREILVGTEYYNSNMLEADGKIRWTIRAGPGFTTLALADLDGDGVLESVYGSMDGNVYAIDSTTGKTRWTANLGDDVRFGLAVRIGDNTCLLAGSESGNVALLGPEGERRWRRDLDAPVTGLALCDGQPRIAAGTAAGWVALLSPEGEIVGAHRMDSGVTTLNRTDLPDGPGLIVGAASGKVMAFVMRER